MYCNISMEQFSLTLTFSRCNELQSIQRRPCSFKYGKPKPKIVYSLKKDTGCWRQGIAGVGLQTKTQNQHLQFLVAHCPQLVLDNNDKRAKHELQVMGRVFTHLQCHRCLPVEQLILFLLFYVFMFLILHICSFQLLYFQLLIIAHFCLFH